MESPGFGQLLRRYRDAAGLTQEALGERAGLSARGIQDLEAGRRGAPQPQNLQRLADGLQLTPDERRAFESAAKPAGEPAAEPARLKNSRNDKKRSPLPTGDVTFLMTDVEGSGSLWKRYPREMGKARKHHNSLIEGVVERYEGVFLKKQLEGDSTFSVFNSAGRAIEAVVELQRTLQAEDWPGNIPIRVRAALHSGEAELEPDGDYHAIVVNHCAYIRALARGRQILVSRTTHDLVRHTLPDGIVMRSLGEKTLKDATTIEVFEVLHPSLEQPEPELDGQPPYWRRRAYLMFVAVLTILILLEVARSYAEAQPPTFYFVVDARSQSAVLFPTIRSEIQKALLSRTAPSTADHLYNSNVIQVGLRLYGGRPGSGCPNTRQLSSIGTYSGGAADLLSRLEGVHPAGHGSLTEAILDAIRLDLADVTSPVALFVISSSVDGLCEPQNGGILDDQVKQVGIKERRISVQIIGVGPIDKRSVSLLQQYARDFHGTYQRIPLSRLHTILHENPVDYGSYQ